jgi:zinc protease
MFGGSVNIPVYDRPLEQAGGENNAFTSNDITNYYLTLPQNNLETAFWLESDRMLDLAFNEHSLDVQRNVVVEEFKQHYLNQPYGDLWLLLRPLAYRVHPYRWSTIGKDIAHIRKASMEDVRDFYGRYYHPHNAILSVVSALPDEEVLALAGKWFGPISKGAPVARSIPEEPAQTEARSLEVRRKVPFDVITMAFHMSPRSDRNYYVQDLLSDVLSAGRSARLYEELVRKRRLFNELDASITGDIDKGLFIFSGKLAEESIWEQIALISSEPPSEEEMEKSMNRLESVKLFGDASALNRAFKLAYAEFLDDPDLVNGEIERYRSISAGEVMASAAMMFKKEQCSTLYYKAEGSPDED